MHFNIHWVIAIKQIGFGHASQQMELYSIAITQILTHTCTPTLTHTTAIQADFQWHALKLIF